MRFTENFPKRNGRQSRSEMERARREHSWGKLPRSMYMVKPVEESAEFFGLKSTQSDRRKDDNERKGANGDSIPGRSTQVLCPMPIPRWRELAVGEVAVRAENSEACADNESP